MQNQFDQKMQSLTAQQNKKQNEMQNQINQKIQSFSTQQQRAKKEIIERLNQKTSEIWEEHQRQQNEIIRQLNQKASLDDVIRKISNQAYSLKNDILNSCVTKQKLIDVLKVGRCHSEDHGFAWFWASEEVNK